MPPTSARFSWTLRECGLLQTQIRFDRAVRVEGKAGSRETRHLRHGLHEKLVEVVARGAVPIRRNGLEKAFLDVRNTYDIAPVAEQRDQRPQPKCVLRTRYSPPSGSKRGFFADVFLGETRLGVFGVKAVDRVRTPPTDQPEFWR